MTRRRACYKRCSVLAAVLPLSVFLSVLLYCHHSAWSALSPHQQPPQPPLLGAGFRKLLQDGDRLHQLANLSSSVLTKRLPSCIIIGVRKCGTRALLEFLNLHPHIVAADDEMHFFNDDARYRQGLEWYRQHMPPSLPHQITVEKTPGYFISPISPLRIHRMNSSVKLLVLLRHPTTRVVSDYTQVFHNRQGKNESVGAFESLVLHRHSVNKHYKAVQISVYHRYLQHWTSVFPQHQMHIVDGDQLIVDPVSEIRQIETFLGVGHHVDHSLLYYNATRGFYCMRRPGSGHKCLGANKGRKHPYIKPSVLQRLDSFFHPHNQRLFHLIHRTFPWS